MTQAVERFVALIAEAQGLVDAIAAQVGDHLGADPDVITWANVGDAGRLVAALREAAAAAGLPGYAE